MVTERTTRKKKPWLRLLFAGFVFLMLNLVVDSRKNIIYNGCIFENIG
ncbi:hypothetical protein SAMN04487895_106137 [Paenibacillus sophorae]|uniref:Uncharacterized protein n=1 Tax=Paenibacillus sophorae TaxID=1333845 RepID=A0A1H8NAM3_9BACL|nr:hypothetical protein SAMN04487895_106137 [Paenibacillus sophorae]